MHAGWAHHRSLSRPLPRHAPLLPCRQQGKTLWVRLVLLGALHSSLAHCNGSNGWLCLLLEDILTPPALAALLSALLTLRGLPFAPLHSAQPMNSLHAVTLCCCRALWTT